MFASSGEIKVANRALGHHWFDNDTTSSFSSKLYPEIYGGRIFVSSERDRGVYTSHGFAQAAGWARRRYTVRIARPDGSIDTVGEYGEYTSLARARRAAAKLAKESTS